MKTIRMIQGSCYTTKMMAELQVMPQQPQLPPMPEGQNTQAPTPDTQGFGQVVEQWWNAPQPDQTPPTATRVLISTVKRVDKMKCKKQ